MHRLISNGRASLTKMNQGGREGMHWGVVRSRATTVKVCASQPCLVLSNDDGVDSLALQSLAAKLRQNTGYRVLVVAPARNKSAASMGLTLRSDMELRARPDLGPDTFALSGTPTDCMMVALDASKGLLRALDLAPVMALSGPNYGPNMGTDVLLSGTVGAARTAGLYGVPSLASSSTSTDKTSRLDHAVDATLCLAQIALDTLRHQPATNWPRNHITTGASGRRHIAATCEYESLPHGWVMDLEQVLIDAFRSGDMFLNLNVPETWQPGSGRLQTTGLGLMFYRDSYLVSVPGGEQERLAPAAAANGNGNGTASSMDYVNGKGNGRGASLQAGMGIAEALAAGHPVVYNNAYDTRRTVQVDRSDVMALQAGEASITTLQTWPEGHTLCLSDRVMSRSLLSGHNGVPAWLQSRVTAV